MESRDVDTVNKIVLNAIDREDIGYRANDNTIISELIPGFLLRIHGRTDIIITGYSVSVQEVVRFTVNLIPALPVVVRSVPVSPAICTLYPYTGLQFATLLEREGNSADCSLAGFYCLAIREIMRFVIDGNPAILKNTKFCVAIRAIDLVDEIAGERRLAGIYALLTEVVVDTINFSDTGVAYTVFIEGVSTLLDEPAVLDGIDQRVGIVELSVNAAEVTAAFAGIIRVDKRLQTEDLLIFRLLREGIQRVCTQVDIIADIAGVDNIQRILIIPCSVGLGRKLNAVHNTQRVCSRGINCRRLVNPSERHSDRVRFMINFGFLKRKVVIDQFKFAYIDIKVLIDVNYRSDFRQNTYALCQLEQERPR